MTAPRQLVEILTSCLPLISSGPPAWFRATWNRGAQRRSHPEDSETHIWPHAAESKAAHLGFLVTPGPAAFERNAITHNSRLFFRCLCWYFLLPRALEAFPANMATMLAPYTNGMRLGQGFNSYTQQICLDQAVLPENPQNRAVEGRALLRIGAVSKTSTGTPSTTGSGLLVGSQTGDEGKQEPEDDYESQQRRAVVGQESGREPGGIEVPPWVKPQIVTYSSRFVDKISDVTGQHLFSNSNLTLANCRRFDEHLWHGRYKDFSSRWKTDRIIRGQ